MTPARALRPHGASRWTKFSSLRGKRSRLAADNTGMMPENFQAAARSAARDELAAHVSRFEQLVDEHSDRLARIELLLDEIAADYQPPETLS